MTKHRIDIVLHFSTDFLRATGEPQALLRTFDSHEFAPDAFESGLSREQWVSLVRTELAGREGGMFLFYGKEYESTIVSVAKDIPIRSLLALHLSGMSTGFERLRALIIELCSAHQPLDGIGHDVDDFRLSGDPRVEEPHVIVGIHDAYWLLVFGKPLVTKLGKKHGSPPGLMGWQVARIAA